MKVKQGSIKILGLIGLVGAIILCGLVLRPYVNIERLEIFLRQLGVWAPIVFIAMYAGATVLFLPGSILTLTGGFLFGPAWGLLYNLVGATIGATIAFGLGRWLARDWVEKKLQGKVKTLKEGVEQEGWKFVAFLRLIPAFPFNVLNYALGLTKISFLSYFIATFIFIIPGAFAYTYLGHLGMEAITGETRQLVNQGLIALSLLMLVAFIPWVVKKFRQKQKATSKEET